MGRRRRDAIGTKSAIKRNSDDATHRIGEKRYRYALEMYEQHAGVAWLTGAEHAEGVSEQSRQLHYSVKIKSQTQIPSSHSSMMSTDVQQTLHDTN